MDAPQIGQHRDKLDLPRQSREGASAGRSAILTRQEKGPHGGWKGEKIMSWWPGWNSIEGAAKWGDMFFWAGFALLVLLAGCRNPSTTSARLQTALFPP